MLLIFVFDCEFFLFVNILRGLIGIKLECGEIEREFWCWLFNFEVFEFYYCVFLVEVKKEDVVYLINREDEILKEIFKV